MIALSGVRSSCESVERNSSFMRPAACASATACCASAWWCALSSAAAACSGEHREQQLVPLLEGPRLGMRCEQQAPARASVDPREQQAAHGVATAGERREGGVVPHVVDPAHAVAGEPRQALDVDRQLHGQLGRADRLANVLVRGARAAERQQRPGGARHRSSALRRQQRSLAGLELGAQRAAEAAERCQSGLSVPRRVLGALTLRSPAGGLGARAGGTCTGVPGGLAHAGDEESLAHEEREPPQVGRVADGEARGRQEEEGRPGDAQDHGRQPRARAAEPGTREHGCVEQQEGSPVHDRAERELGGERQRDHHDRERQRAHGVEHGRAGLDGRTPRAGPGERSRVRHPPSSEPPLCRRSHATEARAARPWPVPRKSRP